MKTCRPSKPKIAITIAYMSLILATSLVPQFRIRDFMTLSPIIQNMLHIPMFAALSILFLQIARNYDLGRRKAGVLTFVFCGIFGLLNEIIQTFVPGRFGGLMDIGLNSMGAIAGIIIYFSVEKSRPGMIYKIICS